MLLCDCEVIIINTQFKKGVLELLVLLIAQDEDKYGYEMVEEVSKIVNVNEGTIYPILKRLTNENYFETYLKESKEGPPRKYYTITQLGRESYQMDRAEYMIFAERIQEILKEEKND